MKALGKLIPVVVVAIAISSFAGGAGTALAAAANPVYRVDVVVPDALGLAINNSGDIVGWQTVSGSPRAFVHRGGQLTFLPNPSNRPLSIARDINDAGVVVGNAYMTPSDEPGHAMRWTSASSAWSVKDLGVLPGGIVSEATGLNEAGKIVGHSNAQSFLADQGFIYTDANGMTGLLPDETFVPQDINELGVVAGNGYSTSKKVDLATGAVTNLTTPSVYQQSFAYALNDSGQVAGSVMSTTGLGQVVARFNAGSGWQELGGIGGGTCSGCVDNVGLGINSAGSVVGIGWPRTGVSAPYQRGVIYLDSVGSLLYVDDLLEAGTQWSVSYASDINDAGQIVGRAHNLVTGQWAAVRLSPIQPISTPDTIAPTVQITYPLASSIVRGVVNVTIRATDNLGVARVELVVGTKLAGPCTLTTSPTYSCLWDTRNWKNGSRILHARAWDAAGNLGTSNVTVTVKNRR